jgi:hypothetical protein
MYADKYNTLNYRKNYKMTVNNNKIIYNFFDKKYINDTKYDENYSLSGNIENNSITSFPYLFNYNHMVCIFGDCKQNNSDKSNIIALGPTIDINTNQKYENYINCKGIKYKKSNSIQ